MSLLKPTPGELADRATILALKISHGLQKGKDVSHFKEEEVAIWERLREEGCGAVEEMDPHDDYQVWKDKNEVFIQRLALVNGILWALEDKVRELPPDDLSKLGHCCLAIARSNDNRSELIQLLNKHYYYDTKPEKLYDPPKRTFVSDIELGMGG